MATEQIEVTQDDFTLLSMLTQQPDHYQMQPCNHFEENQVPWYFVKPTSLKLFCSFLLVQFYHLYLCTCDFELLDIA